MGLGLRVMVFNVIFTNILVIPWRSVLLVDETGVHREIHRPAASHWWWLQVDIHIFYCVAKQIRTQLL